MYSRQAVPCRLVAVLSVVLTITPCSWTLCTPYNQLRQVSTTPAPVEYDSGMAQEPNGCTNTGDSAFCSPSSIPLTNGQFGSQSLNVNDGFAWNNESDVTIVIALNDGQEDIITGVNLYFYNVPSMGIGLPHEIELSWGAAIIIANNPLEHVILGNQDLALDDNVLRNVTIVATNDGGTPYTTVGIRFRFSDDNRIRWLLLTEIEVCNEAITVPVEDPIPVVNEGSALIQLDPNNVQSQLNLSCTAEVEGSFQWQWTGMAVGMGMVTGMDSYLANANRTSFYTLTELSTDSAGSFTCEARYTNNNAVSGSTSFTVQFPPNTGAAVVEASGPVTATINSSATMTCELYGYLAKDAQPQISWQKLPSMTILGNEPLYSISTGDGSKEIQNGGSMPRASHISSLTVDVADNSVDGIYLCSGSAGGVKSITLTVTTSSEVTPTSVEQPTNSDPSMQSDSSTLAIVGGVIGAVAVVILIVVVIVAIFLVMRAKRYNPYHLNSNGGSKDFEMYDGDDPLYQEVSKPLPPPIPIRFPSPMGSSQIDPYATVNNATGNGHFELMDKSFDNRVSVCSEPESNTMPMRLNKQPNFLQNNPLYASADALDRADAPNLPFRREMGSVPPLRYSESPRGSSFNIYAQPSRVAPPIPERPSTPTLLGGPIYSEANITPAVFKQAHRSPASPPDDHMCPYASVYNDPKPLMQSEGPLEVTRYNIREKGSLGVGQFGQVVLAETIGVSLRDLKLSDTNDDRSVAVLVAVKKLKPDADQFIKEAFEKEIKFMTRLRHENVVQLLGICLHEEAFIVMEYMEKGDLNQCLRKSEIAQPDSTPGMNQLPPSTLLYMSLQIANGMKYLASFNFIHRDLATRNCLVGKNNEVKIADFGMSRSLYSSYYYRIRGRAMLPIRWMANECFYGKFSEKTDIWAFGVTMWEIYTFAKKQPYESMTDQEVIDDAIKGPDRTLLTRPEHCPPEVFDVMVGCWVDDPDKRVDFHEVHSSLVTIYDKGSP